MSRRSRLLTVRLDEAEFQTLVDAAGLAGQSVSDYVRARTGLPPSHSRPSTRPPVALPTTTVEHVTEIKGLTLARGVGPVLGPESCAWCGTAGRREGSRFCSPGCERSFKVTGARRS